MWAMYNFNLLYLYKHLCIKELAKKKTRVDKMHICVFDVSVNLKAMSADISEYNDIHFSTSQQLLLLFAR